MDAWGLWLYIERTLALLSAAGLSLAAVAGAAYLFFRFLGERWINHKLSERLEVHRSEQARELERLRHKINGVFDRTKRLHDREFEVLPEIWGKLVEAENWTQGYLAEFRHMVADISRMSNIDLEDFLAGTNFSEMQKRAIKDAPNKQEVYDRVEENYRFHDAKEKLKEASLSLSKHGIFILSPMRADMERLVDLLFSALIERQLNIQYNAQPWSQEARTALKQEGEPLLAKIKEGVIERLWDSTKAEP